MNSSALWLRIDIITWPPEELYKNSDEPPAKKGKRNVKARTGDVNYPEYQRVRLV